jgi:hypothetical protein
VAFNVPQLTQASFLHKKIKLAKIRVFKVHYFDFSREKIE